MFGISFSELFVIAIIALLVIGPEKLPKVARTIGALTGRMQRYAAQVKEEVNREFRFEELQKLQEEIKQTVINTERNINQQVTQIENSIADLAENNIQTDSDPIPSQVTTQNKAPARKPRAKLTKVVTPEIPEKTAKTRAVKETKKTEV